ncbi:hypothetical protein [Microbacterium karelineae]|uniref:hypothetical protein n=1 Tax=Microbacterium karelineae TaxID=2654283 RepID=UPI0012EA386D|nr:hypothetical protein [Microbacterium karelineae]
MSGPKSLSYEVAEEERRRREAVAQARARIPSLLAEAEQMTHEARALAAVSLAVTSIPIPEDRASEQDARTVLERAIAQHESVTSTLERVRRERMAAIVHARLPDAISGRIEFGSPLRESPVRASESAESHSAAAPTWEQSTSERAAEALKALLELDPSESWDERIDEVAKLRERPSEASAYALRRIAVQARTELVDERRRVHLVRAAVELRDSIADIESDLADNARASLAAVRTRDDLVHARQTVVVAREAWHRDQDRRYVVAQVRDVLRELGHVVDDGFEVSMRSGDYAVARRAGDDYALQLTVPRGEPRLLTSTIALGTASDPASDIRAEQESCDAQYAMMRELAQRGVDMRVTASLPVGSRALARRPELKTSARARASSQTRSAAQHPEGSVQRSGS